MLHLPTAWLIRPYTFTNLDDVCIRIESGVLIQAKSRAYLNTGDCLLQYGSDFTYLGVYDAITAPGVGNITGKIKVISGNTSLPDFGNNTENVNLVADFILLLPLQLVAIYVADSAVKEGIMNMGWILFRRSGDDIAFPLAVNIPLQALPVKAQIIIIWRYSRLSRQTAMPLKTHLLPGKTMKMKILRFLPLYWTKMRATRQATRIQYRYLSDHCFQD